MPRYCYLCPECGEYAEIIKPIKHAKMPWYCSKCGVKTNRSFRAEGVLVGAGKRSYHKPIVSNSMAMNPNQIAEHRKLFPDIQVTKEGQPVFNNFADHEAYMKKCNIEKVPQKKRKKGRRIA